MGSSRFNDPEQLSRRIRKVNQDDVDGNLFIEVLLAGLGLKTAAELARTLPVAAAVLTRIRTGRAVSDDMLVKLHLEYGLSISGLKDLLCACKSSGEPIATQRIHELAGAAVFTQRTNPKQ